MHSCAICMSLNYRSCLQQAHMATSLPVFNMQTSRVTSGLLRILPGNIEPHDHPSFRPSILKCTHNLISALITPVFAPAVVQSGPLFLTQRLYGNHPPSHVQCFMCNDLDNMQAILLSTAFTRHRVQIPYLLCSRRYCVFIHCSCIIVTVIDTWSLTSEQQAWTRLLCH